MAEQENPDPLSQQAMHEGAEWLFNQYLQRLRLEQMNLEKQREHLRDHMKRWSDADEEGIAQRRELVERWERATASRVASQDRLRNVAVGYFFVLLALFGFELWKHFWGA